MKKTTLFIILAAIFALVAGLGFGAYSLLNLKEEQATADTSNSAPRSVQQQPQSSPSTSVASSQVPTDNGIKIAYPDAPQAPGTPEPAPTYSAQTITQPTPNPHLDRQDAQAVAKEAITLFSSRTSPTDDTYKKQLEPLTTEELHDELSAMPMSIFTDKYPAAVKDVSINENIKEWGIDTPARYSHYATAQIATQNSGTLEVQYRVAAIKMEQGWTITDLAVDSYKIIPESGEKK